MGAKGKRTEKQKLSFKKKVLENKGYNISCFSDKDIQNLFSEYKSKEAIRTKEARISKIRKNHNGNWCVSKESVRKGWITALENKGIDTKGMSIEEISKRYYTLRKPSNRNKESYLSGLATKGEKYLKDRGVNTSKLSKEELISYSGKRKKENFAKLSDEEKEEKKLNWKKSHLKNFFKMTEEEINLKSEIEIHSLYKEYLYLSGRLNTKAARSKKYRSGHLENRFGRFFFRSSFEEQFLKKIELISSIVSVKDEYTTGGIEYFVENSKHWYFPDFLVTTKSENKYLIEIKGSGFVNDPIVQLKTKAGKQYAKKHNLIWKLFTERSLEIDILMKELV